jgi:hypothetical protein
MKKSDLEKVLNGDVVHIDSLDMYEPTDPKNEVVVLPIHVKKMLITYLDSKINSEQLNAWAEFLCFRSGEYVCEDWDDFEKADYYEDMWYVVQKLSTPIIDGDITPETVRQYLKELDKYFV